MGWRERTAFPYGRPASTKVGPYATYQPSSLPRWAAWSATSWERSSPWTERCGSPTSCSAAASQRASRRTRATRSRSRRPSRPTPPWMFQLTSRIGSPGSIRGGAAGLLFAQRPQSEERMQVARAHDVRERGLAEVGGVDDEGIQLVGREPAMRAELQWIRDRLAGARADQHHVAGAAQREQVLAIDRGERMADQPGHLGGVGDAVQLEASIAAQRERAARPADERDAYHRALRAPLQQPWMARPQLGLQARLRRLGGIEVVDVSSWHDHQRSG